MVQVSWRIRNGQKGNRFGIPLCMQAMWKVNCTPSEHGGVAVKFEIRWPATGIPVVEKAPWPLVRSVICRRRGDR